MSDISTENTSNSPSEENKIEKTNPQETAAPSSEKDEVISDEPVKKPKRPRPNSTTTLGIKFAPLNVPTHRRIQTFSIFLWTASLPVTLFLFFALCTKAFFWPFIIAYLLFILFDPAPENGGRSVEWARRLTIWKYFCSYFPAELVKEAELDPTKNYIFGYHPHGIISMGAFSNFCTRATGFQTLFPGIKPRLLTLTSNFNIPFYRDYLMAMGLASVSRQSCENILSHGGPGASIVIVIGGAAESLNARPGTNDLVLRKRLGFVKMAINQGAYLVPTFSFGENDLYDQVDNQPGGKVFAMQKAMQKALGWTMPLFHGRGMFNYTIGLLPHRRPITTVIGTPIAPPAIDPEIGKPTQDQILAMQAEYISQLEAIYHKYKDVYAKNRKTELRIVD